MLLKQQLRHFVTPSLWTTGYSGFTFWTVQKWTHSTEIVTSAKVACDYVKLNKLNDFKYYFFRRKKKSSLIETMVYGERTSVGECQGG